MAAQFLEMQSYPHNAIEFVVAWRLVFTQDGWSTHGNNAMEVDVNAVPTEQRDFVCVSYIYLSPS